MIVSHYRKQSNNQGKIFCESWKECMAPSFVKKSSTISYEKSNSNYVHIYTHFYCFKSVGNDFKVSRCRHVCNFILFHVKTFMYVYNPSSHTTLHASFQYLFSYSISTQSYMQIPCCLHVVYIPQNDTVNKVIHSSNAYYALDSNFHSLNEQ